MIREGEVRVVLPTAEAGTQTAIHMTTERSNAVSFFFIRTSVVSLYLINFTEIARGDDVFGIVNYQHRIGGIHFGVCRDRTACRKI